MSPNSNLAGQVQLIKTELQLTNLLMLILSVGSSAWEQYILPSNVRFASAFKVVASASTGGFGFVVQALPSTYLGGTEFSCKLLSNVSAGLQLFGIIINTASTNSIQLWEDLALVGTSLTTGDSSLLIEWCIRVDDQHKQYPQSVEIILIVEFIRSLHSMTFFLHLFI